MRVDRHWWPPGRAIMPDARHMRLRIAIKAGGPLEDGA
jgi:hypothetical protein